MIEFQCSSVSVLGLAADADAGVVEHQVQPAVLRGHQTSTSDATSDAEVTSSTTARAVPGPDTEATVFSAESPSRSAQTTCAPAATSARDNAAPIPEPAPVTIAVRPAKRSAQVY